MIIMTGHYLGTKYQSIVYACTLNVFTWQTVSTSSPLGILLGPLSRHTLGFRSPDKHPDTHTDAGSGWSVAAGLVEVPGVQT